MKISTSLNLAALSTLTAAYFDLGFYVGQECTGNQVWSFRVDDNNDHKCHNIVALANPPNSVVIDTSGENDDGHCEFFIFLLVQSQTQQCAYSR